MSRTIAGLAVSLLLLASESRALGQAQTSPEQVQRPTLSVRGRAEVAAPPDLAVIRTGAVVQQATADAAQAQINQIMQRATAAIGKLGVSASQIQTAAITLTPVYTTAPPPGTTQQPIEPRIVAYRASNTMEIRLENLQLLGQVIDAAVVAGANQLEDLSFQIKDDAQYRQEALSSAARQARAKATAIAEALGVQLLGVQQAQEAGVETIRPIGYVRQAMAMAETTALPPVQPGQVRVEANVAVTYLISGAGAGAEAAPRVMPAAPATQP